MPPLSAVSAEDASGQGPPGGGTGSCRRTPALTSGTDGTGGNKATTSTGGGAGGGSAGGDGGGGGGGGGSDSADPLAAATSAAGQQALVEKRRKNCESAKRFRRVQKERSAAKEAAVAGVSADLTVTRAALAAEHRGAVAMLADLRRADATITALLHAKCVCGALESVAHGGGGGGVADVGRPGPPPPPPPSLQSAAASVAAEAAAASAGSGGDCWAAPDHTRKRVRDAMAISSLLTGGDEAAPPPAGRPSSSAGGLKAEPSAACRQPAHPRAAVGFGGLAASAITAAEAAAARSVADRVGHPLTVRTALLLHAPDGVVLAARSGGGGGGGALESNQTRCRHTADAVCVRLLRAPRCSGSCVGRVRQGDWRGRWGTRIVTGGKATTPRTGCGAATVIEATSGPRADVCGRCAVAAGQRAHPYATTVETGACGGRVASRGSTG